MGLTTQVEAEIPYYRFFATVGTTLVSGSGTAATYTVYGRIPGGQNLPAGSYGDSITVTLDF